MKVAILGCGPSGLLAAHAAEGEGCDVSVFSNKEKSLIHGAQYVHEPIPGITDEVEPTLISYAKLGTSTGYAKKVYGSPLAPTSWEHFKVGDHPAWEMEALYERLWIRYRDAIHQTHINRGVLENICKMYDLVFSSIPRPSLCLDHPGCEFKYQSVYFLPESKVAINNMIVYSGRESESWYRTSRLFGHPWTEYSIQAFTEADYEANIKDSEILRKGIKPLEHTCVCNQYRNLVHIGRFGRWEKAVLVSDAYEDAYDAIASKRIQTQ